MRRLWTSLAALLLLATTARAARLENGVLIVNGKPFFPLGSWNSDATTPEDMARLGMNTAFRGAPSTEERLAESREFMRRCNEYGIQVIQYLSYGGREARTPWPPEKVRMVATLASEPNLLAWNVGDDIYLPALAGLRQTVSILREEAPGVPTVADCEPKIGRSEEGATTFRDYVDITCNYDYPLPDVEYPLPGNAFRKHQAFFDEQRAIFGDPLWTWTQTYMWHWTGQDLNVSAEGPGPYPEPEQVRLLFFAEINRGVRGLLCFSHREVHLQPNVAAEIALTFREIALFNDHLAAGQATYSLPTSDPDLDATAFRYGGSTVISAALLRPQFPHWMAEGIVRDASITCPWPEDALPRALLVATPDVVECAVVRGSAPGTVRVTVPSLELAGFVLLSTDEEEIARLRAGVAELPAQLKTLALSGAMTQIQKVNAMLWQSGAFSLHDPSLSMNSVRAGERCAEATVSGRYADAVRAWREAMRLCRVAVDSVGRSVAMRTGQVLPKDREYLRTPYGLHNLRGLAQAPPPNDRWHFIREWMVVGPFALDRDMGDLDATPAGFERAYPPETEDSSAATYTTVDGPAEWRYAEADLSGRLDFLPYFTMTENVLAYARCRVIAPRDMDVQASLGSNDGAKVWVNGEEVFSFPVPRGRKAFPHQDEFPIRLKAGTNHVLVKVTNLGANWRLYLSLDDPGRTLRFVPGW